MNKSLQVAIIFSLCSAVAGCGAKGPLILPEKAAPIEASADEPTDNTPQIDAPATPADGQGKDAVETPTTPAPNG